MVWEKLAQSTSTVDAAVAVTVEAVASVDTVAEAVFCKPSEPVHETLASEPVTPRERYNTEIPQTRLAAKPTPSFQLISDIENELAIKRFEDEMERLINDYAAEVHPVSKKSARVYTSEKSTYPKFERLESGLHFSLLDANSGPLNNYGFSAPISEGTLEDFRDEMDKTFSGPIRVSPSEPLEILWIDDGLFHLSNLFTIEYLIYLFRKKWNMKNIKNGLLLH